MLAITITLNLGNVSATSTNQSIQNSTTTQVNTSSQALITKTQAPTAYIDLDQINSASPRVKTFIETNNRLPNFVSIATYKVTMPAYLKLITEDLLQTSTESTEPVGLETVDNPINPQENLQSGNLTQSEYLEIAETINSSIEQSGTAPDYVNSSLGDIQFESLVYMYSKIMNYYNLNNKLPSTVSIKPWNNVNQVNITTANLSADNLSDCLQITKNAQSDDPEIVALAQSLTEGLTSTYDKAAAIFNWVRDNTTYSYYYNTKKGALGMLHTLSGNCVDHSHLVIALARAAEIPARYRHGTCTFSDGIFGHVWAQLYIDGKWYSADTISKKNSLGVINNWNTKTYKLKGTYAELPF